MTYRQSNIPTLTGSHTRPLQLLAVASILITSLIPMASAQFYSNIVGAQRVRVSQGEQIMSSTPFHLPNATLAGAFTGQVEGGVVDTAADKVLKWDYTTSSYRIFFQVDVGNGPENWVEKGVGVANDEPVVPGEGLWILNQSNPENEIVYIGDVPTNDTVTVAIEPGLQMVHNPYPAAISIGNPSASNIKAMAKGGVTETLSDLVYQWDPEFGAYDVYYLLDDGNGTRDWIHLPADPAASAGVNDLVLEPGQAVWYQRLSSELGFDWVINRPYDLP